MKKIKLIIIVFIIIVLLIKINQFIIINRIKNAINEFKLGNNTVYRVISLNNKEIIIKRLLKNYLIREDYCFENIYSIYDVNSEKKYIVNTIDSSIEIKKTQKTNMQLSNLPNCIKLIDDIKEKIKSGDWLFLLNYFKILYIIPAEYNGIKCYEIKTTKEKSYFRRDTLYPVYSEWYKESDNNKELVKIEYTFEIGTVKDEDVQIPNLEEYEIIEND